MKNEEIFKEFLKRNRKYTSFKRQYTKGKRPQLVTTAIISSMVWGRTDEGHKYWKKKHYQWETLCRHFNLNGRLNMDEV